MRVFFLHRALEAILDQNGCGFFAKKHLPIVWRPEISFFGTPKFHILGTGGSFSDLFIFSKFTESFQNLLSSLGICSLILLYIYNRRERERVYCPKKNVKRMCNVEAGSGTIKGGTQCFSDY